MFLLNSESSELKLKILLDTSSANDFVTLRGAQLVLYRLNASNICNHNSC